jgi:acyl-CoA synthetase (AMP-forming)/AMP-acid ligase II/thioesterase domain-containing protein/acyl carrier protein
MFSISSASVLESFPQDSPAPAANITQLLLRAARFYPLSGLGFVCERDIDVVLVSHRALLREACCILNGLRDTARLPGTTVALLLESARDFIPAWWACVLGGYVPCLVTPIRNDPARWSKHWQHVSGLLEKPLVLCTKALQRDLPGLQGMDLGELRVGVPAEDYYVPEACDPAVLMLTSGSTGNAKAVLLSHGNLIASMAGKAQIQAVTARDVALNWISFDHVAALLEIHLIALYAGASQLHAEPAAILANPLLWLRLIDRYRVTLSFSPNFLLGQINALLQAAGTDSPGSLPGKLDLSCLRHLISGGEANVVETGRRFLELLAPYGLSGSVLRPAFGMTETCAGSIYSDSFPHADMQGEFASVGRPLAGLQMRIVDEGGSLLPPGATGELQLRGPMIFSRYYNNDPATYEAFTRDGWFRSGDLGRIDCGRLTLVGRSKDSIIVSGVNYFSYELETVLELIPAIERSFVAVFPTRPPGADTEQTVVTFATSILFTDEGRLQQLILAIRNTTILLWGFRPAVILPLPKDAFPKTSLGKIQRALLRARLESGALAAQVAWINDLSARQLGAYEPPSGDTELTVTAVFAQVLRLDARSLSARASFFDLGGTSLDIFKLKGALETRFGLLELPVVSILQNPTIRSLALHVDARSGNGAVSYDPVTPLQTNGHKTPLFCIHPGTGEVLVFVSLANYFINERPFYALRARGFNPGEAFFSSMEEMATTYARAIRTRQPHGPYAIAGYSFGAPVAFEVAKLLEMQGERVAFVGSIDGTPSIGDSREPLDFVGSTVIVSFFLSLLDKQQMIELPAQIRASGQDPCEYILQCAPAERIAELNLTLARFKDWADLAYSLVVLGQAYVPTGNVESVVVFYAQPLHGTKEAWLNQHLRRWDEFARTACRYVEARGEHNSLLGPYNVAGFQSLLRTELDTALSGN